MWLWPPEGHWTTNRRMAPGNWRTLFRQIAKVAAKPTRPPVPGLLPMENCGKSAAAGAPSAQLNQYGAAPLSWQDPVQWEKSGQIKIVRRGVAPGEKNMAKKLGDNTPSQTTIRILVCLLENDRFHTLGELAEKFEVSKQTVIRTLERQDLSFFGKLTKEKLGREVAYRIDKSSLLTRLARAQPRIEEHGKALPDLRSARPRIARRNVPHTLAGAVLEQLGFEIV